MPDSFQENLILNIDAIMNIRGQELADELNVSILDTEFSGLAPGLVRIHYFEWIRRTNPSLTPDLDPENMSIIDQDVERWDVEETAAMTPLPIEPSLPRKPRRVISPQFLLVSGWTTFGSGGGYVDFRHVSGPTPVISEEGSETTNNGFFSECRKWVTLPPGCIVRVVSGDCIGDGRVFVDDLMIGT